MLSTSSYIQKQIDKAEPGRIIQMNDFKVPADKRMAMAKELSRMAQKGIIARLEKGKYYKPRQTAFGSLKPSEEEVLNTVLASSNGYVSGIAAFNQLGLTSQVTNTITIVVKDFRPPKEIAGLKIKFRKSEVVVNPENAFILQILDAVRYINKIPDSTPDESLKVIKAKISAMSKGEQRLLVKNAMEYNPATRAMIGAIFELTCSDISTGKLYKSLNTLSKYRLGITCEALPNKTRWSIE